MMGYYCSIAQLNQLMVAKAYQQMRQTIVLSLRHQDSVPLLTQMKKTNTWIGTEVRAVQRM